MAQKVTQPGEEMLERVLQRVVRLVRLVVMVAERQVVREVVGLACV